MTYTVIRASTSDFAISSYFTIPKSYFINYTIPFYNTPNIPKLYFFFLFYLNILFYSFFYFFFTLPFLRFLPQPLAPATTKQTITTTPPLPIPHFSTNNRNFNFNYNYKYKNKEIKMYRRSTITVNLHHHDVPSQFLAFVSLLAFREPIPQHLDYQEATGSRFPGRSQIG